MITKQNLITRKYVGVGVHMCVYMHVHSYSEVCLRPYLLYVCICV